MKCSHCGTDNQSGKFCMKCGRPLQNVKFCTRCGNPISDNLKFCTKCGSPNAFYVDSNSQIPNNAQVSTEHVAPIVENPVALGPNTENKPQQESMTIETPAQSSLDARAHDDTYNEDPNQDALREPISENVETNETYFEQEPPQKNTSLIWIIVLFLLIGLGVAGYLFYANKTNNKIELADTLTEDSIIILEETEEAHKEEIIGADSQYYTGKIGAYNVTVCLRPIYKILPPNNCDGEIIEYEGDYTYTSNGTNLKLKGTYCSRTKIMTLEEYTKSDFNSATWTLHPSKDGTSMNGIFVNHSNGNELTVELRDSESANSDLPLNFHVGLNEFHGNMIHTNGKKYPFTLSFKVDQDDFEISDIKYVNVGSGTTLSLECDYYNADGIHFSGKDGGKTFIIEFNGDNPYTGEAWWGDFRQDIELQLTN